MNNPWEETKNFTGDVKVYYTNLLSHLTKYKRNDIFIETGTYIGNGLNCALQAGYRKCYSIEIHKRFFDNAMIRFLPEIMADQVQLLYGNSETILSQIIKALDEPATFWLDAHISSQYGEQLAKNCPILEELNSIQSNPIKNHTILIDDLNCFDNYMHDNITLDMVYKCLRRINSNYTFELLDATQPNNILIAYVK